MPTPSKVRRVVIDMAEAEAFLGHPRLALIGASDDPKKFGNTVYRALRRGRDGQTIPVNPATDRVDGDACYATVADVPGGVDGAIVMVPPAAAAEAVQSCLDAGVREIWLFHGAGKGSDTAEAIARCEAAGVTLVAGACPLMFLEPVSGIHRFHRGFRRLRGAVTHAETNER